MLLRKYFEVKRKRVAAFKKWQNLKNAGWIEYSRNAFDQLLIADDEYHQLMRQIKNLTGGKKQ